MRTPGTTTTPTTEVSRLQQWFQAVVTHPDGVEAGADSEAARRLIALRPGQLEQVITRSRALTAAERLAVYANAYHARLLECLGEVFPMLKRALGEEAFDGLAFGYLQAYPSRSYTLNDLGVHFADYLEETKPRPGDDDDAIADDPSEGALADNWPELMIDLARLEWLIYEVFDGEGVEGRTLLQPGQVQEIPAEKLSQARLQTAACLRLLATRFPVNDYFTALRRANDDKVPGIPAAAASYVAINRRNFVVRRYNLSAIEYELLRALQAGDSLGVAIEKAAAMNSLEMDALVAELERWFRNWTAEGFFESIQAG